MNLAAAILENAWVRLEPFDENHCARLAAAAEANLPIFAHMPFPVAEREGPPPGPPPRTAAPSAAR